MTNPKLRPRLVQSAADLKPDLEEAERFLQILAPKAKAWTFQSFDDNSENRDRRLAVIKHGTFKDRSSMLEKLNRDGAGVFVAINRTDGKGRKKENIKAVRAVCADLDDAPLDPILAHPLEPHVIVESSPGRFHAYWRVKGLSLEDYKGVQLAIAQRFNGDPEIAKLTHCARLPGFNHNKGEPFRTHIVETNDLPVYTAVKILEAFPPINKAHRGTISRSTEIVLSPGQPLKIAEAFIKRYYKPVGVPPEVFTLRYHRGEFYVWNGDHDDDVESRRIRRELYGFLELEVMQPDRRGVPEPFNPTSSKVSMVDDALKSIAFLDGKKDSPFWITKTPPIKTPPRELIALQNGLLDIETRVLIPQTPSLFNVNALPFDYDPDAPKPKRWLRFLRELWQEDGASRRTLQEIFGYVLTSDTRQQKIFMLIGPIRSGKGTIERVLIGLLGQNNVAAPTLSSLATNFGLQPLINKRVAFIADARLGRRADGSVVTERLLSISGEDALTVDRKYKDPWTGRLGARVIVLTNETPHFRDASGALPSRFIILTLHRSFYGKEELGLDSTLHTELPGILNWALEGLTRLRERGRFIMPKSSRETLRTLEDLAAPIAAFVREKCVLDQDRRVECDKLYRKWRAWCEEHGMKAESTQQFGRDLHATLGSQITTRENNRHKPRRFYQGIGLQK